MSMGLDGPHSRSEHFEEIYFIPLPEISLRILSFPACITVKVLISLSDFLICIKSKCGPGSSVGIATDYVLDSPGSNPDGDEIFRQSRPALGPIQPPVK